MQNLAQTAIPDNIEIFVDVEMAAISRHLQLDPQYFHLKVHVKLEVLQGGIYGLCGRHQGSIIAIMLPISTSCRALSETAVSETSYKGRSETLSIVSPIACVYSKVPLYSSTSVLLATHTACG